MMSAQPFRLPKAGVTDAVIEPYGVIVLWSINCEPKTVDAVKRLNPSLNLDFKWEKFLDQGTRKATTLRLDPLVWINFFGKPSAGTIAHEATHAIGFALQMRGALEEHQIGEEFLAYSLDRLVDAITKNIEYWTQKQMNEAPQLVIEQAEDDGLWFEAQTASEAYLQTALRALHEAVERDSQTKKET